MRDQKKLHLNEDDLLRAIVDERDLPESVQRHLSTCPLCRGERERFEKKLTRLGHMAERFSPSPQGEVRLPESHERRNWRWNWRGALAAGMAAAAVVLIIYGSFTFKTTPEERLAAITEEMQEDERFMMEVSLLTENAFPRLWSDIAGEADPDLDEEFIEFVVPSIEDEIVSVNNEEGIPC